MNKKQILFVCKHNRFRSKIAEAFFNKYNKNKNYSAKSGGLFPGEYPLDKVQVKIAKEFDIKLAGKPKPITTDLLKETNIEVIAADNVPEEIFEAKKHGKEILKWEIRDDCYGNEDEIRSIIESIEIKVKEFAGSLK